MVDTRTDNEIRFVDTTLRDGHLSLWASNMRTGMMLPIAERLDRAGFEAIEVMSSAFYKKCVRDLKEDPWERVRLLRQRIRNTALRSIRSRSMLAFQITPSAVAELWLQRLAANGIDELRTSDPSNTPFYWAQAVAAARRAGLRTVLNIIYSVSPKHNDGYFVERARAAAALDVARICFKDPGGLLTPEATRRLVPLILREAKDKPVEFHTHCNTGLGPICCLEAIRGGIRSINTAIPPLADGSSNPSIFNVAMNAGALGYPVRIDTKMLTPVRDHFAAIAKRENLPVGRPLEYDAGHPVHQVPGGMISNFRFQLANLGRLDRLPAVLEEVGRVRAEFGYPIMVTPYSQFFGVQAAINVIVGARYKEVTDEVLLYALGFWGAEEAGAIDADLRDRLLSSPRAKELAQVKPTEISVAKFRAKFGGAALTDDARLLHYFAGKDAVTAMRASGAPRDYASASMPLLQLIEQLTQRRRPARIYIRAAEYSVELVRRSSDANSEPTH
jgi:oxaloacetate decarboxylase alpha subunit